MSVVVGIARIFWTFVSVVLMGVTFLAWLERDRASKHEGWMSVYCFAVIGCALLLIFGLWIQ